MRRVESPEGRSVRLLRVGEQVRHALAGILMRGDVHDETLASHMVSVTEVRMSPDLRHATAFVLFALTFPVPIFAQADQANERTAISAVLAFRLTGSYPPNCVIAELAPPLAAMRRSWNGYNDEGPRRPVEGGWR